MKKIIFLMFAFAILNGCAEYSVFLGPSFTMAKTGSVVHAGNSAAATYGFKRVIGESPGDFVNSFFHFSIIIKVSKKLEVLPKGSSIYSDLVC